MIKDLKLGLQEIFVSDMLPFLTHGNYTYLTERGENEMMVHIYKEETLIYDVFVYKNFYIILYMNHKTLPDETKTVKYVLEEMLEYQFWLNDENLRDLLHFL